MSDEMQKIVWHTEQRKLGELKEWKKNPRFITDKDLEQLETSLTKFGLADPLIINLDNHLIGGHQRKKALSNSEELVDVRVPDRLLTEKEAEELSIRLNKNQGEWDFDVLKVAFDNQDLVEWGFNDFELGIFQPSQDISGSICGNAQR